MFDYKRTTWDKLTAPFWWIYRTVRDSRYWVNEFFRKIFRGYSDGEWYSFGSHHARYCIPRLVHLRDHHQGIPMDFFDDPTGEYNKDEEKEAQKKYLETFNKIIMAFTYIVKEDFSRHTKLEKKLIKEMIAKYGDEWAETEENRDDYSYHLFTNPNIKDDNDIACVHVPEDLFEKSKKEYDKKGYVYEGLKTVDFHHNKKLQEEMAAMVKEGLKLFAENYYNLWD